MEPKEGADCCSNFNAPVLREGSPHDPITTTDRSCLMPPWCSLAICLITLAQKGGPKGGLIAGFCSAPHVKACLPLL